MKKKRLPPPAQAEWAYFLDVDGTLIDLAEAPTAISVDAAILGLVERLHVASGGALALVSGRSVADLETRLGHVRVAIAGQHGLERRDATGRLRTLAAAPKAKDEIFQRLTPVLARHPALLLEDKGFSLALHYRQAPQLASYVHTVMRDLVAGSAGELCLQKGKRVVEAKPVGVDKGSAIEAFMAEAPFARRRPVFIGDDLTDEHGFAIVNRLGGLSIKVGPGRTHARWRLPDVAAVRRWLGSALVVERPMEETQT